MTHCRLTGMLLSKQSTCITVMNPWHESDTCRQVTARGWAELGPQMKFFLIRLPYIIMRKIGSDWPLSYWDAAHDNKYCSTSNQSHLIPVVLILLGNTLLISCEFILLICSVIKLKQLHIQVWLRWEKSSNVGRVMSEVKDIAPRIKGFVVSDWMW